jgi:cell wall-associated NlpC family hydrolase
MLTPMRAWVLLLCAAALAVGCSETDEGGSSAVRASIDDWRWAPRDELPKAPKAAETPEEQAPSAAERAALAKTEPEPPPEPPEPPALPDLDENADGDSALVKAEVHEKSGVALPPLEAPPAVRAIIEAGNVIARSPYKWGGGHGKWQDNGYDCSGSVSYALAAGGLLNGPLASGPLMRWGEPGKGKWVTIYTNPGHVFMVVAGVRFDTSARGVTGSRFSNDMRPTAGYVARHPDGL